jgi:arylsulfatase A-like enzyme
MCRTIERRDPTRPAFWYCSFIAPHPPIVPPKDYFDLYERLGVDEPFVGDWAKDFDDWPYALKVHQGGSRFAIPENETETRLARIGFYAQCTYIDHQIRLIIGQLREAGLGDDTIVMFTSDHGDMLGNHGLWCKPPMHEWSAKIPMVLVPTADSDRVGHHVRDDRLAELRDIMPTLLDLCDIPVPGTVEGHSLVGEHRREHLYCEHWEDQRSLRMIRSGHHKLIWYPVGNRFQLFDLSNDPNEMADLSDDPNHADTLERLSAALVKELYGTDEKWVQRGHLVGEPDREYVLQPNRRLSGQRGWRF